MGLETDVHAAARLHLRGRRRPLRRAVLLLPTVALAAIACFFASSASAAITGTSLYTGYPGSTGLNEIHHTTPWGSAPSGFWVRTWNERQQHSLATGPGCPNATTDPGLRFLGQATYGPIPYSTSSCIPAGTRVDSHFFHYEPPGAPGSDAGGSGCVTFDADILGVQAHRSMLNNFTSMLPVGFEGFYGLYDLSRGLEPPDVPGSPDQNDDYILVDNSANRVCVFFQVYDAVDEIRVLTAGIGSVTLSGLPASATVGTQQCVTAAVARSQWTGTGPNGPWNWGGQAAPGEPVRMSVTGANSVFQGDNTDGAGNKQFCYTGGAAGTDNIAVFADRRSLDGVNDISDNAWQQPDEAGSTTAISWTKRSTSTAVSCPGTPSLGNSATCTVTVTDTDVPSTSAPTGQVNLSTSGTGTFSSSTCGSLTPAGPASSTCTVQYTPTATPCPHTVTAAYQGDGTHLTSSNQATVTCGATIVVRKESNPNDPQDFTFTAGGGLSPTSFQLDDDADGTLSDTRTFSNVPAGAGYSVSETVPTGWDQISATCSDSSDPGAISVSQGETVTCTFTNRKRGKIVVKKNAVPDDAQDFDFSATGGLSAQKFTFASPKDSGNGSQEIYTINADGTGEVRLTTNTVLDQTPAWSPDGTKITFMSNRDGNPDIYVMNADGSNVQRLTTATADDLEPQWSPDGSKIAFHSFRNGNDEIYVMNADGTSQTRLTVDSSIDTAPAWSPDGTKIAFRSTRDGNSEIYTMNANGSGVARLTNNAALDVDPAWSPNGATIAFTSFRDGNGEIYTMDAATGASQTNRTNTGVAEGEATWSPDGTKIGYRGSNAGNNEIFKMNADGSGQTNVTNSAGDELWPDWSLTPDTFKLDDDGDNGNALSDTRTFDLLVPGNGYAVAETVPTGWDQTSATCDDGSPPSNVDVAPGETVTCTFTNRKRGKILVKKNSLPDDPQDFTFSGTGKLGGKIAFASPRDVSSNEIYTISPDGSGLSRLTNNTALDLEPSVSPDGTRIAFASNRDGNVEVYVMEVDGSNVQRLTNVAGDDHEPSWSKDGSQIAFTSIRDGNDEIYTMDADGSNQVRRTNDSFYDQHPSWSPDDSEIVFRSGRDHGAGEIYTMNADGTNVVRHTSNTALDFDPAWSPTAEKIAFTSFRDGNAEVYTMNGDGSAQTNVTNDAGDDRQPAWSPDGTKLAYRDDASIAKMTATGTERTIVTSHPSGNLDPSWGSTPDVFQLDDDGDNGNALSDTRTYDLLEPGDGYAVSETVPAGWDQTSATCDDGSPPSNIDVAPGETVTCTFTNRKRGKLIVQKDVVIDSQITTDPQDFTFSTGGGLSPASFQLDDDPGDGTLPSSISFDDLVPQGGYSVSETLPSGGWFLADVRCDDNSHISNITIDPGETVTCTFVNTRGYPRPRSATVVQTSLVPAYQACASPNREHGPPLAHPSCNPPAQTSSQLTVGTPDANSNAPNFSGYARLKAVLDNPSTPADEADVRLSASLSDIRNQTGLTDYTGELRVVASVRITDRYNDNSVNLTAPGTASDADVGFTVPCVATGGTSGANCSVTTTMDTLIPGSVPPVKRAIWALGAVRVFDGGTDGDADTTGDNTLFATQGVFVP